MLNLELARIVLDERRHRTDMAIREAGFRHAAEERRASRSRAVGAGSVVSGEACPDPGQHARPALG